MEQVVVGGDMFEWTFAIDKVRVNGQFERWTEISSICRNPVTGERIECVDPSTVDLNSRLITTFVTWTENGLPKTTKSELLVIKI